MPYSLVTKSQTNWGEKQSGEINKLNTFCLFDTEDPFGFPEVKSSDFVVNELIPFHTCKKQLGADRNKTVHFFLDDYKFEQVWTNPRKFIEMFRFYNGIISPTFSIYSSQPYALNLYNMYRSRWITRFYQECGVNVLVDLRWGDDKSLEFCFNGVQKNSSIIVNTVGTKMIENRKMFRNGFEKAMQKVEPSQLYVYGEYMPVKFEEYAGNVQYFPSFWSERRESISLKKVSK